MPRFIAMLLAGALAAVALGGSSCTNRNEHPDAPPPPPGMSDDIKIGDQEIAPQQLQPPKDHL